MEKILLLVDDEQPVLKSLKRLLRREPYTILTASDGFEALEVLAENEVQVVLSDFRMPGMTGGELLKKAVDLKPSIVGMLLSGHADLDLVIDSLNSGAVHRFMSKPWQGPELLEALENAFLRWQDQQHSMKMARMSEAIQDPYIEIDQLGHIYAFNTAATKLLSEFDNGEPFDNITDYFPDLSEPKVKLLCGIDEVHLESVMGEQQERYEIYSKHIESSRWMLRIRQVSQMAKAGDGNELDSLALNRSQVLNMLSRWGSGGRLESTTVIYIDLVKFHVINDGLGYRLADKLLAEAAKRMSAVLPVEARLGHMNADEFVVLFPNRLDFDACKGFTQSLKDAFCEPFKVGGRELRISFKAGVAWGDEKAVPEDILQQAHVAVTNAKTDSNSEAITAYQVHMSKHLDQVVSLQSDLYLALERNELSVHYQPKVAAKDHMICGAEALVRWHHPTHGWISPGVFIPVAEASGLIDVIGEWVLLTACTQAKVWELQGVPSVPISVNLSGYQLSRDNLVARVNHILGSADYDPLAIQFEVTETFLMQDLDKSERLLRGLREQGMKIALDDFGTGYSSLNYLSRLPIDTLKIDKSFVDNIAKNEQDSALIKHIIDMSHSLNIDVVAEGVEQSEQVNLLTQHGCDLLQGFHFSKAVPADEFKRLLVEQPFTKK
ncbi:MAG: EAL domain-containing response regulator [Pontibacterium sp.]